MDGRQHVHQRVGAQAVLADDDDVAVVRGARRGAGRRLAVGRAGGAGWRDGRGRRRCRRPGPTGRVGAACSAGDEHGRATASARDSERRALHGASERTDGLARFPICLNLAPSDRFVFSPVRLRPALRLLCSRSALCLAPLRLRPRRGGALCRATRTASSTGSATPAAASGRPSARARRRRRRRSGAAAAAAAARSTRIEPAQAMFRFGADAPRALALHAPGQQADHLVELHRRAVRSSRRPPSPTTARCCSARTTASCTPSARDGTLKWSYATGDIIFSSPAVAHDGTIYIGSDDDHLYARRRQATGSRAGSSSSAPARSGSASAPRPAAATSTPGPTVGPDGVIYTGRRRHLRHQPRRDAALAVRDQRPRLVGAGAAARRHGGGRLPGRHPLRHRARTARSAGTSAPAATSSRARPSATTARSTSAPTTASSTRSAPTARCAGPSPPAATCAPRPPSATA